MGVSATRLHAACNRHENGYRRARSIAYAVWIPHIGVVPNDRDVTLTYPKRGNKMTFNLTEKRLTALTSTIDAMGAQDAATLDFDAGIALMRKAGFKPSYLESAGKGGAGEPGVAYDATMNLAATRLFNQEELAVWNAQEKGPELSALKRRASNYVMRVKRALEGPGKGGKRDRKTALDTDRDAIAKRISVINNAIKADTDARKQTLAEYGGELEAGRLLAAWDVLRAQYGG